MKTLYQQWSQIKHLLPFERQMELETLVNKRFTDVFDKNNNQLTGVKYYYLVQNGKKTGFVTRYEDNNDYQFRQILCEYLTDEEYDLLNSHSYRLLDQEQESRRFENADHIKKEDYDGMVWAPDDQVMSIQDYLSNEDDLPKYIWAAKSNKVFENFDIERELDDEIETYGPEDMNLDECEGLKELKIAVDKFKELNKNMLSYSPDCSTAIIL